MPRHCGNVRRAKRLAREAIEAEAIEQGCEFCGEPVDTSIEGDSLAEVYNTKTGESKLVHSEPCFTDITHESDWEQA